MNLVGEAYINIRAKTDGVMGDVEQGVENDASRLEASGAAAGESLGGGLRSGAAKDLEGLGKDAETAAENMGSELEHGASGMLSKVSGIFSGLGGKLGGALDKAGEGMTSALGKVGSVAESAGLELGPLSSGLEGAASKMEGVEGKSGGLMTSLSNLGGKVALGAAGGFLAVSAASVKLAMTFDTAVGKIAAKAGIPVASAHQIGEAFLTTAGQTTFSGQQIAEAYAGVAGQLGQLAGHALTSKQALTVMRAAMDLAEGSGTALGTATKALSTVMQVYHMRLTEAANVSDKLFNTSRILNVPVTQLAQGIDRLKGRLGALAPDLSDTSTLMVELGSNGIKGSRGAMLVNSAFQTLLGGSKATASTLQHLGVSLFDSNGKFVGLRSAIAQLQPKLAAMTTQTRILTEKQLFGASAGQAMNNVIMGGIAAYTKAAGSVNKLGTAHDAAEKSTSNLKGQFEKLKSAIEDNATKWGEVLIPIITKAIGVFTKIFAFITDHKPVMIALGVIVGGVLVAAFGAWAASLFMAGGALDFLLGPIGLIIAGIALLAAGIYELVTHWNAVWTIIKRGASDIWHFLDGIWHDIENDVAAAWDWIRAHLGTILPIIVGVVLGPIGALVALLVTHWNTVKSDVTAAFDAVKAFLTTVWHDILHIVTTVINAIKQVITSVITTIKSIITTVWTAIKTISTTVWSAIRTVITTVWSTIKSIVTTVVSTVKSIITSAWNAVRTVTTTIWNGIVTFFTTVPTMIWNALGSLGQLMITAATSAWNAFKGAAVGAFNAVVSWFTTTVPNAIKGAFGAAGSWLLSAGGAILHGLAEGILSAAEATIGHIPIIGGMIVSALKSALGISSPSRIARAIGRTFIGGLPLGFTDALPGTHAALRSAATGLGKTLRTSLAGIGMTVGVGVGTGANGPPVAGPGTGLFGTAGTGSSVSVNVQPGAVVIEVPTTAHASAAAEAVDQAFYDLAREIKAGTAPLRQG